MSGAHDQAVAPSADTDAVKGSGRAVRWLHRHVLTDYFFRKPRVFISYRREDLPEVAALVHRAVVDEYKRVAIFLDVDTLVAGDDFPQAIKKSINASDLVIAIVGPKWIGPMPDGGAPRIQNANDFVRLELEEAIRAGKPLMVLHWGPTPPATDAVPRSLGRVLRPKWTNVSERQLRQLIGRERRHRTQGLSWLIPVSMFALQMAAWLCVVPIGLTLYEAVAQKRADAVALNGPSSSGKVDGDIVPIITITADGETYLTVRGTDFNQPVPLASVGTQVRAVLNQCLPACAARAFIRGDRSANPAIVFSVVRQLAENDVGFVFVTERKD